MLVLKDALVSVIRNFRNLPGWSSREQIVVLESDDWGCIRVPSRAVRDAMESRGLPSSQWNYNRLDALESNDDLEALFDVLRRFRDSEGRPAILTANVIMGNPDFRRIRQSDFTRYHWEPFAQTAARYPRHDRLVELYRDGIKEGVFHPQLHGREHLQINRWMTALRQPDSLTRALFEYESTYSGADDYNYMEAFDQDDDSEAPQLSGVLKEAADEFRRMFGHSSSSFIAPCYTWTEALEKTMPGLGIKFLQGAGAQLVPRGGFGNYETRRSTLGKIRQSGLISLTRNCFFEPSLVKKSNWVPYTVSTVADAFRWGKPAVICSHRINYIGYIDERNRTENLRLLADLLGTILRRWPSVRFLTSDQLGDRIAKSTAKDE